MNLINQNKIYKTSEHYNWISIQVGNSEVKGALQEQISYSVEANYDKLFSLDSYFNSLNTITTLFAEKSLFSTGLFTKRFWKSGGYLRINPKFRIVDHAGDGQIINDSIKILNSALPISTYDGVEKYLEGVEAAPETIDLIKAVGDKVEEGFQVVKSKINGTTVENIVRGITANQPRPVKVKISSYFEKLLVAESVNVTFSHEMIETKSGKISPLYADFDCIFGTQEITTFGSSGLSQPLQRFRVQ